MPEPQGAQAIASYEIELIERIHSGERNALVEFIQLKKRQLYNFVSKRLSDRLRVKFDPEDVLQELTTCALDALPEMDFRQREPFSWLCFLAERRIIDEHRKYFETQKRAPIWK